MKSKFRLNSILASFCLLYSILGPAVDSLKYHVQPTVLSNNLTSLTDLIRDGHSSTTSSKSSHIGLQSSSSASLSLSNVDTRQMTVTNSNSKSDSIANGNGSSLNVFGTIELDPRIIDGLGGLLMGDSYDAASSQQRDNNQHQQARDARRLPSMGSLWNKPKVSPLYLINGTVCRFVNSNPICTTLSTQGLLRKLR